MIRETDIQKAVMAQEHLRPVSGYPGYFVSSTGHVFSSSSGSLKELKHDVGHKGHRRVTLYSKEGTRKLLVHRIVLSEFVGPAPTDEHFGCHRDDNASNNNVHNLYWGTRSDNARDSIRNGGRPLGEKSIFARLTEDDVREITRAIINGERCENVAKRFYVSSSVIRRIATGRSWAHLDREIVPYQQKPKADEQSISEGLRLIKSGISVNSASLQTGVSRKTLTRLSRPPVIKEKVIHAAVIKHWETCGLPGTLVATIANERAFGQPGLTPGLPDLILIGPGLHGYLELKTEIGKLSGPQQDFQSLCMARGIPFYVTYGRDEPIRLLEELGIVRRAA